MSNTEVCRNRRNAVTYEEPVYETLLLQKLKDIEDLLRAFLANLEEPTLEKEATYVKVKAPEDGKIIGWYKTHGDEVKEGEPLCEFEPEDEPRRHYPIDSPAKGILRFPIGTGKVTEGTTIAIVALERVRI